MKRINTILIFVLLAFSTPALAQSRSKEVSPSEFELGYKKAQEFGITNVTEIKIHLFLPSSSRHLRIRGDEFSKDNIGEYKELYVPVGNNPGYKNNDLYIRKFIEIEIGKQRRRVIVYGVNEDIALNILNRFYTQGFTYDDSVKNSQKPSKLAMKLPESFSTCAGNNCYKIILRANCRVIIKVENDGIEIKSCSRFVN
jgi:hypothetical protein